MIAVISKGMLSTNESSTLSHQECMSPPQFTLHVNAQKQGEEMYFQDFSYLKGAVRISCWAQMQAVTTFLISVNSKEIHRHHFYTIQH